MPRDNKAKNDQFFFDLLRSARLLVNRDGSVWKFHNSRRKYVKLSPKVDGENRLFIQAELRCGGHRTVAAISLSRLVWMNYHRRVVPENHDIHHKDSNNTNNRPGNLLALTPEEHDEKHYTPF